MIPAAGLRLPYVIYRLGGWIEKFLSVPVATTFMAKGVISDKHPMALGTIGFMQLDYANFGFDQADLIIAVGYDLVE